MRHLVLFTFAFSICLASAGALIAEDPKADPQSTLEGSIAEMIRLLEAKEHMKLIKTFASPDDVKGFEKQPGGLEQMAERFGENHARRLLASLKQAQKQKLKIEDDGVSASFEPKKEDESLKTIKFRKVDKKWYVLDR